MNKAQLKVIEALESGKYRRCEEYLHTKKGSKHLFCAMGVACDVLRNPKTQQWEPYEHIRDTFQLNGFASAATAPDCIANKLNKGFPDIEYAYYDSQFDCVVMYWNDSGLTFKQIAKRLRRVLTPTSMKARERALEEINMED